LKGLSVPPPDPEEVERLFKEYEEKRIKTLSEECPIVEVVPCGFQSFYLRSSLPRVRNIVLEIRLLIFSFRMLMILLL
jgi:hypothetical protein